jgi:hypothetical protein
MPDEPATITISTDLAHRILWHLDTSASENEETLRGAGAASCAAGIRTACPSCPAPGNTPPPTGS